MINLSNLEEQLGIIFKDQNHLQNALIHRSYVNENPNVGDHNERLEFLGDAVLELAVTENLYNNYPNPEGDLTNWRASLVNAEILADIAESLTVEKYLKLSKGEAKDSNSKARRYILADAMEAIIGAIYIDQNYEVAKKFIVDKILVKLPYILENELYIDAKSKFQEQAQAKTGITPTYQVLKESGPDHEKQFKVGIYLDDDLIADGDGTSKQEAQMSAAENALIAKNW